MHLKANSQSELGTEKKGGDRALLGQKEREKKITGQETDTDRPKHTQKRTQKDRDVQTHMHTEHKEHRKKDGERKKKERELRSRSGLFTDTGPVSSPVSVMAKIRVQCGTKELFISILSETHNPLLLLYNIFWIHFTLGM